MTHNICDLQYVKIKFGADKRYAKLKAKKFIVLETYTKFRRKLIPVELRKWGSFVSVVYNFLGNRNAEIYIDLIHNLLTAY